MSTNKLYILNLWQFSFRKKTGTGAVSRHAKAGKTDIVQSLATWSVVVSFQVASRHSSLAFVITSPALHVVPG